MNQVPANNARHYYVRIDERLCKGCVLCMKACPTKAIRVKADGVAHIEGLCIDCGECLRVCPKGAIEAVTTEDYDLQAGAYTAVSASSATYTQFGRDVMPNDILLGLRSMGFRYVHDQAYTNEIFNTALEIYIKDKSPEPGSPRPFISPVCPVVVQLIAYRFPSLLQNIPPLITPREIVAREAKRRLSAKYGCGREEIKVFHITPCPAKMTCIKDPILQQHSYMDGTIGIGSIYENLMQDMHDLQEDKVLHHSGGLGLGWAASGGEVSGLSVGSLAVSGMQETILYLEKIEMGLLPDVDYVEFRICSEGCIGGPFTVADKYVAKQHLQRLVHMFGKEKRVKYAYARRLYEEGWFFTDKKYIELAKESKEISIPQNIQRLERVGEILQLLPGKECGYCGSPDCTTFAEDVVDGRTSLDRCPRLYEKRVASGV